MLFRVAALALGLMSCGFAGAQVAPLPPGTRAADSDQPQEEATPLVGIEARISNKDYAKAVARLDTYLAAHPNDARALFDRGYCDDAQGRVAEAKEFYQKAVAADPKQFEARLALGLILAKEGGAGAQEQLRAAATLEPNPPNPTAKAEGLRALARLVRQTDPQTAKQALMDALRITPETPEDTLLAAEIAEAAGDDSVAEQAYRQALKAESQSAEAIAGLAHLLMSEKRYADAEPLLKAALTRDPDDPSLNAQYAALLAEEGKTGEALTPLEKLHQLKPKDRGIAEMLADVYAQAGDLEKADAVYAELLAGSPTDADLEAARGQVLIREKKYAEALVWLQKAVTVRQNDPDTWAGIAFSASKTGRFDLTLEALAMRSKLAPETSATYFLWATANDSLHRKKQALEYYQLFLKLDSGKLPNEEWQARQRIVVLAK